MTEQRHNGKPVRQGTNHGRLCKSRNPFPDAITFLQARNHKQQSRANQEPSRYGLIFVQ
jgi:hypothetical protein